MKFLYWLWSTMPWEQAHKRDWEWFYERIARRDAVIQEQAEKLDVRRDRIAQLTQNSLHRRTEYVQTGSILDWDTKEVREAMGKTDWSSPPWMHRLGTYVPPSLTKPHWAARMVNNEPKVDPAVFQP